MEFNLIQESEEFDNEIFCNQNIDTSKEEKKPVIIQTDSGLEFKNKMLEAYLKEQGIKHILSRPHHPQINECLERYHRELHKYMKNYLDDIKDFDDSDIEDALDGHI